MLTTENVALLVKQGHDLDGLQCSRCRAAVRALLRCDYLHGMTCDRITNHPDLGREPGWDVEQRGIAGGSSLAYGAMNDRLRDVREREEQEGADALNAAFACEPERLREGVRAKLGVEEQKKKSAAFQDLCRANNDIRAALHVLDKLPAFRTYRRAVIVKSLSQGVLDGTVGMRWGADGAPVYHPLTEDEPCSTPSPRPGTACSAAAPPSRPSSR